MKIKKTSLLFILLLVVFMVFKGSTFVFASESMEVEIPLSAAGADCTAVIMDEAGNMLGTLALKDGETKGFKVFCEGLGNHRFSIKLSDEDTRAVIYDKTEYKVNAELFLNDELSVFCVISADPVGVIGGEGKPEKLEFKNTRAKLIAEADPPVIKRIVGNPPQGSIFTFEFKAADKSYPMPDGSAEGLKRVSIDAAGDVEFGMITFTEAGLYEYTVYELNTGIPGCIYDTAVYTIRYLVREQDGALLPDVLIFKDQNEADSYNAAVFTNSFKEDHVTPKTGDGSNLIMWSMLSAFSVMMILAAALALKARKKD